MCDKKICCHCSIRYQTESPIGWSTCNYGRTIFNMLKRVSKFTISWWFATKIALSLPFCEKKVQGSGNYLVDIAETIPIIISFLLKQLQWVLCVHNPWFSCPYERNSFLNLMVTRTYPVARIIVHLNEMSQSQWLLIW